MSWCSQRDRRLAKPRGRRDSADALVDQMDDGNSSQVYPEIFERLEDEETVTVTLLADHALIRLGNAYRLIHLSRLLQAGDLHQVGDAWCEMCSLLTGLREASVSSMMRQCAP